jgi:hypothetical protein
MLRAWIQDARSTPNGARSTSYETFLVEFDRVLPESKGPGSICFSKETITHT